MARAESGLTLFLVNSNRWKGLGCWFNGAVVSESERGCGGGGRRWCFASRTCMYAPHASCPSTVCVPVCVRMFLLLSPGARIPLSLLPRPVSFSFSFVLPSVSSHPVLTSFCLSCFPSRLFSLCDICPLCAFSPHAKHSSVFLSFSSFSVSSSVSTLSHSLSCPELSIPLLSALSPSCALSLSLSLLSLSLSLSLSLPPLSLSLSLSLSPSHPLSLKHVLVGSHLFTALC